jgi:hypothetical protein
MARTAVLLAGVALASSGVAAHETTVTVAAADRYVVFTTTENARETIDEARGCVASPYPCVPGIDLRATILLEVWTETNGRPGLQRTETCPDGSAPVGGACPGGQPVPPDRRDLSQLVTVPPVS